VFDFVSIISRIVALVIGAVLISLVASDKALYSFLSSPGVLPTCLCLLFLIIFFDKLSAAFSNWRLRKSGQPYALEHEEHGHHGHGEGGHGGHGSVHEHHESLVPDHRDHRKSTAWSMYSDTAPLTGGSTAYDRQSYAMSPLMSPPLQSPPIQGVSPAAPHAPGGYMPVSHGQNYGA
jgi:hypothetical protein